MAAKRQVRNKPAVTRGLLLDVTEQLMVAEGYAAVTTRRVASKLGVTGALVHYYYPTTDDLLLAAYQRAAERHSERVRGALASDRPLHALWNLLTDSSHMALGAEFMALANHRKVIRMEIAQHDERTRRSVAEVLGRVLADAGIDSRQCSPLSVAMMLSGISRAFVMEEILGISCAHRETRTFLERLIGQVEKERKSRSQSKSQPVKRPQSSARRSAQRAA